MTKEELDEEAQKERNREVDERIEQLEKRIKKLVAAVDYLLLLVGMTQKAESMADRARELRWSLEE